MTGHKKQTLQIDPYLVSPKAFHLEMPLYHKFDLAVGMIAEKVFENISYGNTIDAYCVWCDKESVFNTKENIHETPGWESEYHKETPFSAWMKRGNGLRRVVYSCTRVSGHNYYAYYLKEGNFFVKFGQFPSAADFQIPQAGKYRKVLGEEQYKEMTRGLGLIAYGVGIGSFVYLRRIFENLIEEAHVLAQREDGFLEDTYKKARMDEKIEILRNHLPDFLVENKVLYSILSKGIHELSENECLQYFETVKIGIEEILDEKIIRKERADKALKAKEAIRNAHGEINGTK